MLPQLQRKIDPLWPRQGRAPLPPLNGFKWAVPTPSILPAFATLLLLLLSGALLRALGWRVALCAVVMTRRGIWGRISTPELGFGRRHRGEVLRPSIRSKKEIRLWAFTSHEHGE